MLLGTGEAEGACGLGTADVLAFVAVAIGDADGEAFEDVQLATAIAAQTAASAVILVILGATLDLSTLFEIPMPSSNLHTIARKGRAARGHRRSDFSTN